MKKMLAILLVVAIAAAAVMSTGCLCGMCNTEDGFRVAILLPEAGDDITQEVIDDATAAIQSMSSQYAIEYIIRTTSDAEAQNSLLDQVLAWNADAIVLWCNDSANENTIKYAKTAVDGNKALILMKHAIEGVTPTCMVNVDGTHDEAVTAVDSFITRYLEDKKLEENRLTVGATGDLLATNREESAAVVESYLRDNGKTDVNIIVCDSDEVALGVMDAFESNTGKEPDVRLIIALGGAAYLLSDNNNISKCDVASASYGDYSIRAAIQLACHYALKDSSFGLDDTTSIKELGASVVMGR